MNPTKRDASSAPHGTDSIYALGAVLPVAVRRSLSTCFLAVCCLAAAVVGRAQSWQGTDIGTVAAPGNASTIAPDSATWIVRGSGADIWENRDAFYFVHQNWTGGDVDLITRVSLENNPHSWAKAGLMFRAGLGADAANVLLALTPGGVVDLQSRATAGGATTATALISRSAPQWLKLSRRGSVISGYYSADGATWELAGSISPNLGATVAVGMAVTSHNDGVLFDTRFHDVWLTAPGLATPTNLRVIHRGPDGRIDLAWNDTSTSETGFVVEKLLVERDSVRFSLAATAAANATQATSTNNSQGVFYRFRVKAVQGNAASNYSDEVPISTTVTPLVSIGGGGVTSTSVALRAEARMNTSGGAYITGPYSIERSTDGVAFTEIASRVTMSPSLDYVDRSVSPGTTYHYRVRFLDTNGDSSGYGTLPGPVTTPDSSSPPAAPSNLAATATSSTEVRLTWTDNSNDETGFVVLRSIDNANFSIAVSVGANVTTAADPGRTAGTTYYYRVAAKRETSSSTVFSPHSNGVSVSMPGTPPAGPVWANHDIGTVGAAGRFAGDGTDGGEVTVSGSGGDIWGTGDAFNFTAMQMTGDGEIYARLKSIDNTDPWAKAGVMIRDTLDPASPNAFMAVNPSFTAFAQRRDTAGQSTTIQWGADLWPPVWVRMTRSGNSLSLHYSIDGARWELVSSVNRPLPATVYAGLAVTSHRAGTLCNATFDRVVALQYGSPPSSPTPPPSSLAAPSALRGTALSATSIQLNWTDNSANETRFEIERASAGATFTRIGTVAANVTSYTDQGLSSTVTYSYRVRAANDPNFSAYSNVIQIVPSPVPGPGWGTAAIGNYGLSPSGPSNDGENAYTLRASGEDIWGTADGFFYAYKPLSGDGQIVARVQSMDNTHAWAKAGVMIRETLQPGSRHALVYLTPNNGAGFHARSTANGATSITGGPWWADAPYWLKLVRSGNTFTSYTSADGVTWTLVTSQSLDLAANTLIGLAVSAHDVTQLNTVSFTDVRINSP